jgi:putative oxidoreductase
MKAKTLISVLLRLLAAIIMLQTLYFKFTAQPESVYIFSSMGIEPWGRIGTGVVELIAAVLLLMPATVVIGALMAAGIMLGALATHLFVLGIQVQGDGGQLFGYAVTVLLASIGLLFLHFPQLISYKRMFISDREID